LLKLTYYFLSVGRLLRNITDSAPRANTESFAVKEALAAGDMAPEKSLNQLLETNLRQLRDRTGIIVDGYPRNLQQVKYFENKVIYMMAKSQFKSNFNLLPLLYCLVQTTTAYYPAGLLKTSVGPRTYRRYGFLLSPSLGTLS